MGRRHGRYVVIDGARLLQPVPQARRDHRQEARQNRGNEDVNAISIYLFFRRKARIVFLALMTYAALC